MRSSALLVVAGMVALLTGCASQERQQAYVIPDVKLAQVRHLLANRSSRLETLFMEAAYPDNPSGTVEREVSDDSNQLTAEKIVLEVLQSTNSDKLLPDAAFEKIHDIVGHTDTTVPHAYALALSQYILNADFQCRRPLYFQYFKNRYGFDSENSDCSVKVPFSVLSNLGSREILWLNPERVSSVHVLFAASGNGIMSRFGHLSIRLIVCPEGDDSQAACDSNLYEHLVLGYRAHVDELKIDPLAGLNGGYRAYLYANRFMDTYQEYAIGEFRELYSLPLKLNDEQRVGMVKALSEVHWSYTGEYKFLSNNCSSIAQNFLLHTWDEFSRDENMHRLHWRPDRFFSKLKKSPRTDSQKLNNLTRAEQQGYFFLSTRPIYEEAFALVREATTDPEFRNIDEYVATNPAFRLKQATQDASYLDALSGDLRLLNAQLLLEEISVIRYERRLMAELAYYLETNEIVSIEAYMREQLSDREYSIFSKCIFSPALEQSKPLRREDGMPTQVASLSDISFRANFCSSDENQSHIRRVYRSLSEFDSAKWAPVEKAIHFWSAGINNLMVYTEMEESWENTAFH